jgi:hypothetical protein
MAPPARPPAHSGEAVGFQFETSTSPQPREKNEQKADVRCFCWLCHAQWEGWSYLQGAAAQADAAQSGGGQSGLAQARSLYLTFEARLKIQSEAQAENDQQKADHSGGSAAAGLGIPAPVAGWWDGACGAMGL